MIKKIFGDELVRGSFILFVMMNLFNVMNYIFHFSMARMLGPEDYGILVSLMSIFYIFGVPARTIENVIINYTSKFFYRREFGKISGLIEKGLKKSFILSGIVFLGYLIFAIFLSGFLRVSYGLMSLMGVMIFFVFTLPILRGVLQGEKKFFKFGWSMIIEGSVKLLMAIFLVWSGWKIYGAIGGVLGGSLAAAVFSFLVIKKEKKEEVIVGDIYKKGWNYFLAVTGIILFYSLDVILARRFFSGGDAGEYAVASMIGKIIFFGTFGVSKVMFPMSSGEDSELKSKKILRKASFIIFLMIFIAMGAYFFFPELVVSLLYGSEYLEASSLLIFTGGAMSLLAVANVFIMYGLSRGSDGKKVKGLLLIVFLEVVMFYLFHENLVIFSKAFLFSSFIFLLYGLLFLKSGVEK